MNEIDNWGDSRRS